MNGFDCGIFVIYFVRAFFEAPEWVKDVVKTQLEAQCTSSEPPAGPNSRKVVKRAMAYAWGTEIPVLRSWLRLTLLSWIEYGIPGIVQQPTHL